MSWLMISVGIGSENFNFAADRAVLQASEMGVFDKCIALKDHDIRRLIPELESRRFNEYGRVTVGNGFYSWKPRVSKLALAGEFGKYDNLLIVDAGCEFFRSAASLLVLKEYMSKSISLGVLAFAISTPECLFTKRSLFANFPNLDIDDMSGQFQSGVLFFSGNVGREIVQFWDEIVWKDVASVDETLSKERDGFCAHRHDQSVLSLVLKSLKVLPSDVHPAGLPRGLRSTLACYTQPIWWARNRTGDSRIPVLLKLFGYYSDKFPQFSVRLIIWISRRINKN